MSLLPESDGLVLVLEGQEGKGNKETLRQYIQQHKTYLEGEIMNRGGT